MKFFPHSLLIHVVLAFLLVHMVGLNTSSGDKIEVKLIQKDGKVLFPPTSAKSAKPRSTGIKDTKGPKSGKNGKVNTPRSSDSIDLSTYANQLKVVVDPVWYRNIAPYLGKTGKNYFTEVLIFLDKSGNVRSVKILKSSGYSEVDQVALNTFREIATLPKPPEVLVKEGIIWTFSTN